MGKKDERVEAQKNISTFISVFELNGWVYLELSVWNPYEVNEWINRSSLDQSRLWDCNASSTVTLKGDGKNVRDLQVGGFCVCLGRP